MRKIAGVIVALFFTMSFTNAWAQSDSRQDAARKIFEKAVAREASIKDYHVFYDHYDAPKDKSKGSASTYEYWFKKPDFIKIKVVSGDNKGVRLAYRPDADPDKVHVKKSFIPLTMAKDDKRLNGFFTSDYGADLADVKEWAKGGKFLLLKPDKIHGVEADVIELDCGPGADYTKAILWIDANNGVLLQYEYYRGDKLAERKTWYNYEIDKGLKSGDFKP